MADEAMTAAEVRAACDELSGWAAAADGLSIGRQYEFPSFVAAVRFVDFVAELAEAADHHPDIDIRYNRVRLVVSTHSAGGVTAKDFDLARAVDQA